jgi:parallel beta-helix repeat protein
MKKAFLISTLLTLVVYYGFGQTTIPDNTNISGNWTLANSPYIIEGRAIVPNGQTLTIEPGVEIKLTSSTSYLSSWFNYSAANVGIIRVQGEIIANGTSINPILFTRNNTGNWGSIIIDQNASTTSSFTNCIIEYANETREVTGIASPLTFDGGISLFKTSITFKNNELRNNRVNGIYVQEVTTAFEFSNNLIFGNGANGAVIQQSIANGINNIFYNNSIPTSGSVAAIISSNSDVYLVGNLIYNNDDFGIYTKNGGNNYLVNNTIYNNFQGVRVETAANTYIKNSIIQNNATNFTTSAAGSAILEINNCLTNSSTFPANMTNVSGNLLSSNAQFTNTVGNDFSLQSTSPAIDAGNPNSLGLNIPLTDLLGNTRIDNNIIDQGAIEFQQPTPSFTITTSSNPTIGGNTSGGGTFTSASNVTVSATPNQNYSFVHWTENGIVVSSASNYSFTATANRNLVANFEIVEFTIITSSNPTIGGNTSGGGTFISGSNVTVSATPNQNYSFVNWTENGIVVSSASNYSFTATANRNLVANFEIVEFTVITSSNPTIGGNTSGGGTFTSGSNVTVSATPNQDYAFVNWTENGTVVSSASNYSFTATANRNLVANFELVEFTVITSSNPTIGGNTSGGGTFISGSNVTVSATPNQNYSFVNWTENGIVVSSASNYSFTATANRNLVANFEIVEFTVITSSNPTIGGNTSGGGTFTSGSNVTVSATPNQDYAFVNWTENGTVVSSASNYSFTATANRNLVANFELVEFTVITSSNPTIGGNTSGGGTFTSGSNVTVSATPNQDYTFVNWTENGTVVSSASNYSFTATANRNLVANFELTLSIQESKIEDNDSFIYPNPTEGKINIELSDFSYVEIYSSLGKLIFSTKLKTIDITTQPAGIYLLKIKSSNGLETTKKIVKK